MYPFKKRNRVYHPDLSVNAIYERKIENKRMFDLAIVIAAPSFFGYLIAYSLISPFFFGQKTMADECSGKWKNPLDHDNFIDISRIMVKNSIRVCGDFYIRECQNNDGEFLCACTPDGTSWHYYIIDIYSGTSYRWLNDDSVKNPY